MKTFKNKAWLAAIASALILSACGGGGGDESKPSTGPQPDEPTSTTPTGPGPAITGKAIDGYLANALVCLDMNSNNSCDVGEPTAMTDAHGDYRMVTAENVVGKKLLVMVTSATKDLSRPGYVFPSRFTLSATIDGMDAQHITPITTMVQAQIETGATPEAALATVVSLIGGGVNLKDDYIANNNTAASAFASQVVDKVTQFAVNGATNVDAVRAVMVAIAEKGDVASVTQADVDAAAKKPVYTTDVDATTLLADSLYTPTAAVPVSPALPSRQRTLLNANKLEISTERVSNAGVWSRVGNFGVGYMAENFGVYALNVDGNFTGFIPQGDYRSSYTVASVTGSQVNARDDRTGIDYTFDYRRADLGGKSPAAAMPSWVDTYLFERMTRPFPLGAVAYKGSVSRSADEITVPITNYCLSAPEAVTITEEGFRHCNFIGDNLATYTSVDQVFGLPLPTGEGKIRLAAGGVAQVVDNNGNTLIGSDKISWTRYDRNPNVLVINFTYASLGTIYMNDVYTNLLRNNGKLLVVLHNGHLKLGMMMPAKADDSVLQYTASGFDQLAGLLW